MPKTGTSFLQKYVFPYLDNIYYLDLSKPEYSILFRDFFFKNLTIYTVASVKQELHQLIEKINKNKILISDESWFGSTLGGSHFNFSNNYYLSKILIELFPDAKIILTIRRQDKWLESMYRHIIRDGYSLGINKYLNYHKKVFNNYISFFRSGPNIDIKGLNFMPYIDNYERLFGTNNLLILNQELLTDNIDFLVSKICGFVNESCTYKIEYTNNRVNSGYLYIGVILARILNIFFIFKGKNGGFIPIPKYKYLDFRKYVRLIDKVIPVRKRFITEEMKRNILDYHSVENANLDMKYNLGLKKYKYYE